MCRSRRFRASASANREGFVRFESDDEALERLRHRLVARQAGGTKISAILPSRARRRDALFRAARSSKPANDNGTMAAACEV
jgi:hypothetical protein